MSYANNNDDSKCQYCRYIKCTYEGMIPNLIEFNNQYKSVLNDVSSVFENNKCHVFETPKPSELNLGKISWESCRRLKKKNSYV